jgi:ERCC4-related helicase
VAKRLRLPVPDFCLAGLATIADMVPLTGINRIIGKHGLNALRTNPSVGIRALAEVLNVNHEQITSSDIGFLLGPAINAAGRLEDGSIVVKLLTCDDRAKATSYATQLLDLNKTRKDIQRQLLTRALIRLKAEHEVLPPVITSYHPEHHQGVVGLIASGLANRYARPAFAFAKTDAGVLSGSARSGHHSIDLYRVLETVATNYPDLLIKWGGHKAAAGLSIYEKDLPSFTKAIADTYITMFSEPPAHVDVVADAELTLALITPQLLSELENLLEPLGQGFSAPNMLIRNAEVVGISPVDGHRVSLKIRQGRFIRPAFISAEIWNNDIKKGDILSITATPAQFFDNTKRLVQFSISAYRKEYSAPECPETSQSYDTDDPSVDIDTLERGPSKSRRVTEMLNQELQRVQYNFDGRFIYKDLADKVDIPFETRKPTSFWEQAWRELKTDYSLAFNHSEMTFRRAQVEFVRFFFDFQANQILQAPTGSGKTEIAFMIASHYLNKGSRVIFTAPTNEIVNQTAERAERILEGRPVNFGAKQMSPQKRARSYHEQPVGFFVGTPHVFSNDIESSKLLFQADDLLIIDEAHHTTGKYPSVALVEAARAAGARVLLISATPAQTKPQGSWKSLSLLKEKAGVDYIFPLNVASHDVTVRPKHIPLTPRIERAVKHLNNYGLLLRTRLLNDCNHYGLASTKEALQKLLREPTEEDTFQFPSAKQIRDIRTGMTHPKSLLSSNLRQLEELSRLTSVLTHRGIFGFLSHCLEGRARALYPTEYARSNGRVRAFQPPKFIKELYTSKSLRDAYNCVALTESVYNLWDAETFRRFGEMPASFFDKQTSQRNRLRNRNEFLVRCKKRLMNHLVSLDYCDHPKEKYVLSEIRWYKKKTFISVQEREHAIFLAARINHYLGPKGIQAVCLTGSPQGGKLGITKKERETSLTDFGTGSASVLIGTSASNEGVDIDADRGYCWNFDASATKAKQKEGRVGRHTSAQGEFEYLCSCLSDYIKLQRIMRKMIDFHTMLNEQRSLIQEITRGSEKASHDNQPKPPPGMLF